MQRPQRLWVCACIEGVLLLLMVLVVVLMPVLLLLLLLLSLDPACECKAFMHPRAPSRR
jgi:hypothetical protein